VALCDASTEEQAIIDGIVMQIASGELDTESLSAG
jgi:hypothetical protein